MITGDQILAHLFGDYVFQSHWMATRKTKSSWAALLHVVTYSIGFWYLRPSLPAMAFIIGSHFVIDRFRLARHLVFFKNFACPPSEWDALLVNHDPATGYPKETPAWMSVWLLIIADNALHLLCNGFALTYL